MKMSKEVATGSNFLWYGVRTLAQNYLNRSKKMEKILNQFNNICYIRRSFNLKMQNIFETSTQRVYLKCGAKSYKQSILRLEIIE